MVESCLFLCNINEGGSATSNKPQHKMTWTMPKDVLTYWRVPRQNRFQGWLIQRLSDVLKVYSTLLSAHIWVTYGLNGVPTPPKRYFEVLILNTWECDLICKWGIYRGNQVKMRSNMTGVLIKKWHLDTEPDKHRGETMWRHTERRWPCDWGITSTSQEHQGLLADTKRGKKVFPPRAIRESIALLTPRF